jgi:hypothetical protein
MNCLTNTVAGPANISTGKWGKKKSNYYGTSYVDKDFGGVADLNEEELLDLEEEDAIMRQKRLDSANNYIDFAAFDYDPELEGDDSEYEVEKKSTMFHSNCSNAEY